MRKLAFISAIVAALFVGCDPAGLRRVQLRIPPSPSSGGTIELDEPQVQEALRIVDRVVTPLGFRASSGSEGDNFIRVYTLTGPTATVGGQPYSRVVPIRIRRTPTGIEAAFGEFGFLGGTPEPAVRAFVDVRAAFVKRFGRKQVHTKRFGSANKTLEPTAAGPSVCGGTARFAALQPCRCSVSGGCGSAIRSAA